MKFKCLDKEPLRCEYRTRPDAACRRLRSCAMCGRALSFQEKGERCPRCQRMAATLRKGGIA